MMQISTDEFERYCRLNAIHEAILIAFSNSDWINELRESSNCAFQIEKLQETHHAQLITLIAD